MIFSTQLELNITIKDINAIYSTEYEQMLLDHAKVMYERTCRDGQYVKSINRLIKRSLPNLIKRDLNAKVRVYVIVEATVIRYDQYDFITGMKVNKVIPAGKIGNFDMIECRNDHVVALMKLKKGIDQFKIGDTIPIRVGQSMYKIGNGHILVNGYPFLPYVPDQLYYSIDDLSIRDKEHFNKMILPLLETQLKRKEELNKTRWDSFSKLLHPYKNESKTSKSSSVELLDIDSYKKGFFSIDYHSNLTNLCISIAEPKASESITIIGESKKMALTYIGFQFVKWLETINDLTETYDSDDNYNQIKHVWDQYIEYKI